MTDFYQKGDCFPELKTASEQRANGDVWREQLQIQIWNQKRDEIYRAINELWKIKGLAWVNIWEEQWFSGIERFLSDLQEMGYHVYIGDSGSPNNQGKVQKRYCVYLEALPDTKEWSIDEQQERHNEARLVKRIHYQDGKGYRDFPL